MLKGNTAIVTGASRGIGAAIAKKLASLGANVAVLDIGNEEQANEVCKFCEEEYGVKAAYYSCNVADFEQTKAVVTKISKDFENVTILINNAGIIVTEIIDVTPMPHNGCRPKGRRKV